MSRRWLRLLRRFVRQVGTSKKNHLASPCNSKTNLIYRHYKFKTIAIFSEVQKSLVLDRLSNGAIAGCGAVVPPLTEKDIRSTPRIVSQMGPEPFVDAMKENPDFNIIVGGRAYDPSPYVAFAAYAARAEFKDTTSPQAQRIWGGFTHMGKVIRSLF